MDETAVGVVEEGPQMSFFQRLTGIFFEPGKTFADIDRRPTWLAVFLIMAVFTIPFTYTLMSHIDTTTQMRQRLEARGVPQEQIEQQIQITNRFTQSPIYKYGIAAIAPVMTLVSYIVIASLFLLLFMIMGAPLTFRKSLATTFWGFFPPGIVSMILSVVIILAKNEQSVDPQHILMSNLGFLTDGKAHAALFALLSSFDIFTAWTISLLSIGFAAISDSKMSTRKAATGIIALWALYVLGKVGYNAIFG
jgi:hypothetical protein